MVWKRGCKDTYPHSLLFDEGLLHMQQALCAHGSPCNCRPKSSLPASACTGEHLVQGDAQGPQIVGLICHLLAASMHLGNDFRGSIGGGVHFIHPLCSSHISSFARHPWHRCEAHHAAMQHTHRYTRQDAGEALDLYSTRPRVIAICSGQAQSGSSRDTTAPVLALDW